MSKWPASVSFSDASAIQSDAPVNLREAGAQPITLVNQSEQPLAPAPTTARSSIQRAARAREYVGALIGQDECGARAFEIRRQLGDDRCGGPRQSPGFVYVGAVRDSKPLGPHAGERGTLPGGRDLVPDVRALTRGLAETIHHASHIGAA
jgi:hypothetical protein